MKKIIITLLFLISIFKTFYAYAESEKPSLIITTINGQKFNLSEKKGKVVLINFWAKWCGVCLKEMNFLDELNKELKDKNFEIIGLNTERKRRKEKVAEIAAKLSYQNAIFAEAEETNFEEPNSLPTIYIVNKEGKIHSILQEDVKDFSKENITKIVKSLM
ncbi:MAG: TlpA family protein disulfide reductase [Pelagibacterales bacterium]|nr:TlpA family protein disulfide reductase [Pelagibacterales bacterium]